MKTTKVEKPVMTLKSGSQTFHVWVLEVGQWCQCTPARCHEFHATKTGSIIYESFGVGVHECVEHNLNAAGIWGWIQEHMQNQLNTLNQ